MKRLLFLTILVASSLSFAQEGLKADLIDEFGDFNCEEFLARMDNFYIQLNNQGSSQGYLVISGDNTTIKRRLAAELLLESAVAARKYDRSRIQIIQGPNQGKIDIKLWIVPTGIAKPDFYETRWEPVFQIHDAP